MHSPYYKERRQLKTFLTQIGPALPLTLDPPVRLRDDQKGGTTIKIAIWGAFLPKKLIVFSPTADLPTSCTHNPSIYIFPPRTHVSQRDTTRSSPVFS
jgi:hypothetical protein